MVFDKDETTLDDFEGEFTIQGIDFLKPGVPHDQWYTLNGVKHGQVRLILCLLDFGKLQQTSTDAITSYSIPNVKPSRITSVQKRVTEKKVIEGEWKDGMMSGLNKAKNPQVNIKIVKPSKTTITLERLDQGETMGLTFYVCKNDGSYRLTSLENVVGNSAVVVTSKVEHSINLESGTYTIIPMLQKMNTPGKFRISVTTKEKMAISDIKLLPPNVIKSVFGKWEGENTGGYNSTMNPQYELKISKRGKLLITLERTDGQKDGIAFFVVRALKQRTRRLSYQPSDIIHKSRYVYTSMLSEAVLLDVMEVPFIIIPTMQKGKTGSFKLTIECVDDLFTLSELPKRTIIKKEINAQDILAEYKKCGSNVLFKENPIEKIIERCKETGSKFIDHDFPPTYESVNKGNKGKEIKYDKWQRVEEFLDDPQLYVNGIEVEDMIQGAVGDCWLCEAIAALAAGRPERVQKLFYPQNYSEYGVYSIRHFDMNDNSWKYVIVDDMFPTRDGKTLFARSSEPNEIWVMLLEKSFAKVFGSYRNLNHNSAAVGLKRLTGGRVDVINLQNADLDKLWNRIQLHVKDKWIMGATSCAHPEQGQGESHKLNEMGIVSNHAYSVIDAKEVKGHRLLKVRNTWGHTEWTGDWSDTSELWTPEIKKQLGFVCADDGTFWMSLKDFQQHYCAIYFCKLLEDKYPEIIESIKGYWDSTCNGFHSVSNPTLHLMISTHTMLHIDLQRTDSGKDIGVKFLICREESTKSAWIQPKDVLAQSPYLLGRYVSLEVCLEPSKRPYVLIACLQHSRVIGSFKLRIFSDNKIGIKTVKNISIEDM